MGKGIIQLETYSELMVQEAQSIATCFWQMCSFVQQRMLPGRAVAPRGLGEHRRKCGEVIRLREQQLSTIVTKQHSDHGELMHQGWIQDLK